MHVVREMSHSYDRAAWSAETVIHRLDLPEERDDATGPHMLDAPIEEANHPTDATTIMGRSASSGGRTALEQLIARIGRCAEELRPRVETFAASMGFILRRVVQKPIFWALAAALFALAVRSVRFEHPVSPTPLRIQVVARAATLEDLECLAIEAVAQGRSMEAVQIYRTLAARAPEHSAYARAAEIVARSAD